VIGSPVAKAQVPDDAIRNCAAKSNDKERLACFDESAKTVGSSDAPEDTANTSKVLQPTKPTEYRVADADDIFVAPNKYVDKPIELRRIRCLHADKDECRCIAPGSTFLIVFAAAVEPAAEKEAVENEVWRDQKATITPVHKDDSVHARKDLSGYCFGLSQANYTLTTIHRSRSEQTSQGQTRCGGELSAGLESGPRQGRQVMAEQLCKSPTTRRSRRTRPGSRR
jgi:hypothetical protein